MGKKRGRPTKLTQKVIDTLKKVVEDAIYLTDKDLVFLLNEKLDKKEKISYETFRAYKNGNRQGNSVLMSEFVTLIKKTLIQEKKNLLKELRNGEFGWQAKAWILERKFTEWNLKQISETDITTKGKELNSDITVTYADLNNK